ncbi:hypothetical protein KC131_15135 [Pseudomonas sp. JQ170]|uniref:hypothetical protein n=1 Tax=unclassified Pseudomonas TaxID=196821 RepID=UPI0026507F10|nr:MULTISPECIES: hypothetical protein [unclassified Pseudomonas]MDN7141980.1 hypothetical protein [Pseudomonas sp. JQ170]WRO78277.1 hypothetical protein U9R80_11595 [Pseudomonas sp. 170C]
MYVKLTWKQVFSWPKLALGAAATALIVYAVEHGEFPAWLSRAFSFTSEFLATSVSLSAWIILLPVVVLGSLAYLLTWLQSRELAKMYDYSDRLKLSLEKSQFRCKELEQQIEDLSNPRKALEEPLPISAFNALNSIALLIDSGINPLLMHVGTSLGVGWVEAHAAIDILKDRKMIQVYGTDSGPVYELTPQGRAYYIEHRVVGR